MLWIINQTIAQNVGSGAYVPSGCYTYTIRCLVPVRVCFYDWRFIQACASQCVGCCAPKWLQSTRIDNVYRKYEIWCHIVRYYTVRTIYQTHLASMSFAKIFDDIIHTHNMISYKCFLRICLKYIHQSVREYKKCFVGIVISKMFLYLRTEWYAIYQARLVVAPQAKYGIKMFFQPTAISTE